MLDMARRIVYLRCLRARSPSPPSPPPHTHIHKSSSSSPSLVFSPCVFVLPSLTCHLSFSPSDAILLPINLSLFSVWREGGMEVEREGNASDAPRCHFPFNHKPFSFTFSYILSFPYLILPSKPFLSVRLSLSSPPPLSPHVHLVISHLTITTQKAAGATQRVMLYR